MSSLLYFIILVLSAAYILLSVVTELEFLLGRFTLPLPYGLLAWSVLGIWVIDEPYAFVLGFVLPYISVYLLYATILVDHEDHELLLLRHGTVTIPILPGHKGEIRIDRSRGNEFHMATATDLIKPLQRGTEVIVIARDGQVLTVSDDLSYHPPTIEPWLHRLARIVIYPLLPGTSKTGTCLVCYQQVRSSHDVLQCPRCHGMGHYDHLSHWVRSKGFCPQCRSGLLLHGHSVQLKH